MVAKSVTKNSFNKVFKKIIEEKEKYDMAIVVVVNSDMKCEEFIKFSRDDFEYKLEYYNRAYGVEIDGEEFMILKSNKDIFIENLIGTNSEKYTGFYIKDAEIINAIAMMENN